MTAICRFCSAPISQTLVDLGKTPLANAYLSGEADIATEKSYPLKVVVCNSCWLVQTTETVPADAIFNHGYAYLSSYSAGWVAHAKDYALSMIDRFGIGAESRVIEIASNDGYLLKNFVKEGIPVLGIEPAGHAAEVAQAKGVQTQIDFFTTAKARQLKAEGIKADLMVANNVLAHVPDIKDFAAGFSILLDREGVATFEFPHLANMIQSGQFDTIYHEHYSYLSLAFVERLFESVGLQVFDVEILPTHGGSLRVFACHIGMREETANVQSVRERENALNLTNSNGYLGFAELVETRIGALYDFLITAKHQGKSVAGYGAAAKGNTFLNVGKIGKNMIQFVVDRNTEKQGTLLPGSHIPVYGPEKILEEKPDYLVILPWNVAAEVMKQQASIRDWDGRFVTAMPKLNIT